MENIVIPDDFYISGPYLCHRSCILGEESNGIRNMSNDILRMLDSLIKQSDIDDLRYICNMYDILDEKTCFEEGIYMSRLMFVYVDSKLLLNLFINGDFKKFNDINKLLEYLEWRRGA